MPIIVTSKPLSDIEPDLEQANKWGIAVLTMEDLEAAFNKTLVTQNADHIYDQAEQEVQNAKAQYDLKGL